MQIKLLKDIVATIVGQNSSQIVDLLHDKKNVNEFFIAKKLGLTINQTRNVLYKLADEGLVSFIRKKDARKGGWYTYYWTLNSGKSLSKFRDSLLAMIAGLQDREKQRIDGRYYACMSCHLEYDEESALNNNFICKECGEPLILKDNSQDVAQIRQDVEKHKKVLQEVEEELNIITAKDQKALQRKIRAELKKKQKERMLKKKQRDRTAKKEALAKERVKRNKNSKKKKK